MSISPRNIREQERVESKRVFAFGVQSVGVTPDGESDGAVFPSDNRCHISFLLNLEGHKP